jgi:myo-inositol 2-dehydrogenase / D-chiro-inositol 1-dehydrogenase
MLQFCLIGAGRIGAIHARNITLHGGARVKYVVDVDADAARRLATACGAEVSSVAAALADPHVNAVLIASSTDTHAELIQACARAGKAVFCEKPLDLDITRARASAAAAKQAGVHLAVGFNRRCDPAFSRLKREILSGAVGQVEVVTIISRDPSAPPASYVARSGGLFRDMMIHDLDMARWLLAEEPVTVFARGSALADENIGAAGDIDTAVVVLETSSGKLCHITDSRRCVYGYDQRIEVFGSQGLVRADNVTATSVAKAGATGFTTEPALPFFLERYASAYRIELEAFVTLLRHEPVAEATCASLATADDGLRALVLADAAQKSLETGQPVRTQATL